MIALLLACATAMRVGLVEDRGGATILRETSGRAAPLVLDERSAWVAGLRGCIVEVEGAASIGGFVVSRWRIRDAGDGTAGFVGTLAGGPGRLFLTDQNSGSTLRLDATAVPELATALGRPVLVLGFVADAGTVRVVAWRAVDAAAPPGVD